MLKLATIASLICVGAHAQSLHQQLTTPEYKPDVADVYADDEFSGNRVVKISEKHCEELKRKRELITAPYGTPEFEEAMKEIRPLQSLCYQDISEADGKVVGFSFSNDTENAINPRTADHGSTRDYRFVMEGRSKQNLHLEITENSGLTSRMSHDFLETTIVFVPRRVVPYIKNDEQNGVCVRKVALPTNELVIFDALTKEIIGGVLEESPMDMTESRHTREFAGLEYTGNGIMIRADRRAGTPGHEYNVSYNVNERIKEATLTRKGKTCHVPKKLIWENTEDANKNAYFMYETDQEFLDKVVNPICGWNLSLEDIM